MFETIIEIAVPLLIVGIVIAVYRILREKYEWIDTVTYGILIVGTILVWIFAGFWYALLVGFIGLIAVGFLMGDGTSIRRGRSTWNLTCPHCGYDKIEIIKEDEDWVVCKCKRCGQAFSNILRRR